MRIVGNHTSTIRKKKSRILARPPSHELSYTYGCVRALSSFACKLEVNLRKRILPPTAARSIGACYRCTVAYARQCGARRILSVFTAWSCRRSGNPRPIAAAQKYRKRSRGVMYCFHSPTFCPQGSLKTGTAVHRTDRIAVLAAPLLEVISLTRSSPFPLSVASRIMCRPHRIPPLRDIFSLLRAEHVAPNFWSGHACHAPTGAQNRFYFVFFFPPSLLVVAMLLSRSTTHTREWSIPPQFSGLTDIGLRHNKNGW